jgi:RimK family alpha-L-glutamate ligase
MYDKTARVISPRAVLRVAPKQPATGSSCRARVGRAETTRDTGYKAETFRHRTGAQPYPKPLLSRTIPAMSLAVVAHRVTPTNTRLGLVLTPAQAVARLGRGDVAVGRLDVLATLDGVEPGLWALDRLEALGVRVLNARRTLVAAHDKLATAEALFAAGVAHPRTVHVASWLPLPELEPPLVFKPRFGSWGEDVIRCDDEAAIDETLATLRTRPWFDATGAVAQKLVAPRGYDLRLVVARGRVIGAVRRVAAPGEWRTNVALGARREPIVPSPEACDVALAAAAAIDGDLVGVDLLPADLGTWVVLEVNGAVDFNSTYSLDADVFEAATAALASVDVEAAA